MVELFRSVVLVGATIAMGLIAGLLYAYACSVMLGLRRTDARTFIDVMQRINAAILNGWFALSFFGALVLSILAALLHLGADQRSVLSSIAVALVLYGAALAITFGVNIPLNNDLDAAGDPHHIPDPTAVRVRFEMKWVRWNIARAISSTAAFGALAWALVLHGRAG